MLSADQFQWASSVGQEFGSSFDNWIDTVQWLNPESVNWVGSYNHSLSLRLMIVGFLG